MPCVGRDTDGAHAAENVGKSHLPAVDVAKRPFRTVWCAAKLRASLDRLVRPAVAGNPAAMRRALFSAAAIARWHSAFRRNHEGAKRRDPECLNAISRGQPPVQAAKGAT